MPAVNACPAMPDFAASAPSPVPGAPPPCATPPAATNPAAADVTPSPGRPGPGELLLRVCAKTPGTRDCRAALLLDGALLDTSPATATIPADGERLLTALPLGGATPGYGCYGITRALRFVAGAPCGGAPDVDLYDWGGGVFEAVLHLPSLCPAPRRIFPFTVARLPWEPPGTRERLLAVLYRDDGLWLTVENGARVLCGYPMEGDAEGELYTTMRCLVAVTRDGERQEALVLGPDRRERLRILADRIDVADGCITATDALPTQRGHERRTRYLCRDTEWEAETPETGFFTHAPRPAASAALAMLEALQCGAPDEALSFLSPVLRDGLDGAALTEFFGAFSGVRPYFTAVPERVVLGLTDACEAGVTRCRRFSFSMDAQGRIDDIEED